MPDLPNDPGVDGDELDQWAQRGRALLEEYIALTRAHEELADSYRLLASRLRQMLRSGPEVPSG